MITKLTSEKQKHFTYLINKGSDLIYFCGTENGSLEMIKHSLEANKEDSSVHVSCQDQSVHVRDDVPSYVHPGSNARNSKIVNSCSTIHNLYI